MKDPTFTPGPWTVRVESEWSEDYGRHFPAYHIDGGEQYGPVWLSLARVYESMDSVCLDDEYPGRANAALIAAAPALYAACEAGHQQLEACFFTAMDFMPPAQQALVHEALDAMSAALAAARSAAPHGIGGERGGAGEGV